MTAAVLTQDPVQTRAARVRLAIFDVDGVFTDGRLYFDPDGREMKVFDVKDGHGLVMLRHAGIEAAVISARESSVVEKRMRDLGVVHIRMGRRDKLAAYRELLAHVGMEAERTSYMGDDLVDLGVLMHAGLAATVADAHDEVKARAHWISRHAGGRGAVRELCELLLRAGGLWDAALKAHLP